MNDTLLHDRESCSDTEQHLKDNGEKFNRQCVMVLKLLYSGRRYTGKQVNEILDIACGDRRLRNLFAARKDVRREWVYTSDGKKTRWKEYWLEGITQPTKHEVIEKADAIIRTMKDIPKKMEVVFELPDEKPNYQQASLFNNNIN